VSVEATPTTHADTNPYSASIGHDEGAWKAANCAGKPDERKRASMRPRRGVVRLWGQGAVKVKE